jgi:signal transduction histidine kinase
VPEQPEWQNNRLLDAVVAIGAELDLAVVLRRIVAAAVDLVDARYGALGVVAEDGLRMDDLVQVGMDDPTVVTVGPGPSFCGVLGPLIDRPLRLSDITAHPRAYRIPPGHPPMRSFLGVPIRIRDTIFGNLYLTEKKTATEFTEEDERLAYALATAAGVAVQNARLYEASRQREKWLIAASEVTRMLLSGADEIEVFTAIAEHVRELTCATDAAVVLPTQDGRLRVVAAAGEIATSALGLIVNPGDNVIGEVFRDGVAVNMTESEVIATQRGRPEQLNVGPTLLVPLSAGEHTRGVLGASRRRGDEPFPANVMPAVQGFAEQAELACELAERRRDSEALSLFADRDRIARNLHDLVIQRLFATGMALEGAANLVGVNPDDARNRIRRAVGDLDTTIKEIRTTVFALQQPADRSSSLRAKIIEAADAAAATLGFAPSVRFDGPIDTMVEGDTGEQLLAVLREALSNVARHAHASAVRIEVSARERLVLQVCDNGVGMTTTGRRSGLANMESRARQLGGELTIGDGQPGTMLCWSVPLRF